MKLKILVTAGDGIGPEVTNEAVAVLQEVAQLGGHTLALDNKRIGGIAIVTDGTPLPPTPCPPLLTQMPFSSVRWVAMSLIPSHPTSALKPACCNCAPLLAALPISVPPSPSKS